MWGWALVRALCWNTPGKSSERALGLTFPSRRAAMAGGSVWSREEAEFRASNGECVGTLLPGAHMGSGTSARKSEH
jgi:hypothetical protein